MFVKRRFRRLPTPGAAAFLGGVTRMTISLAVILLECTGDYKSGLPLIATLMTARFVGNYFNMGIFDELIDAKQWPILEEHAKKAVAAPLSVKDVMVSPPRTMNEVRCAAFVCEFLAMLQKKAVKENRRGKEEGVNQCPATGGLLEVCCFFGHVPLFRCVVGGKGRRGHRLAAEHVIQRLPRGAQPGDVGAEPSTRHLGR